jgi:hypothetical protein
MEITTIEEAFKEIEKEQERVPVEGIEYLYNHEKNEEITNKLAFSLENAYNKDVYYNKAADYYYPTPLWYAIVAENHLSEELVQPIISLYTPRGSETWDYLDEQGHFLIGKISKELGEKATNPFLDTSEEYSKKKTRYSTLYLHECLFFVDQQKDLPQILRILENEEYVWIDSLAIHLAEAEIKGALPRLKEILKYHTETFEPNFTIRELELVVKELETGVSEYPEMKNPMFERRRHWKEEYKDFYKEPEPVYQQTPVKKKNKIGRNEPCPCGSGKKYKRCCLNK